MRKDLRTLFANHSVCNVASPDDLAKDLISLASSAQATAPASSSRGREAHKLKKRAALAAAAAAAKAAVSSATNNAANNSSSGGGGASKKVPPDKRAEMLCKCASFKSTLKNITTYVILVLGKYC